MKKNKLIIFMPSVEDGGVEKNFFLISNYLAKKFADISIISISNKIKSKLDPNINLISLKSDFYDGLGRRKKFFICLLFLLKEIMFKRNNVVFCFQGNIYCTLLCKIFFTKVIIRSNTSPSGWSKSFLKIFFYKKFYGLADKIIVNSIEFKKEFKKKFNLQSICIYNPLNKQEILIKSNQKIRFKFFTKRTLNLICIARLSEQKDHFCLLKAIYFLKNKLKLKVLFIGNGKKLDEMQTFIKKKKLSKIINIIPFKKNPFPYLKKSDALILSSNFEGLPNVLLEALTLKKLVISSNCPTGPKEILDYGKGGLLFRTGHTQDLVKKIIYLSKNKKICKKKTIYGYNRLYRFKEEFNLYKFFKLLSNFQIKLK